MLGSLSFTCVGHINNTTHLIHNPTCSIHGLKGPRVMQCHAIFYKPKALYSASILLQAKGREAIRSSGIIPALLHLLGAGSQRSQAGAAAALANLSCEPQSVRLIRRSNGIPPLVHLLGFVPMGASEPLPSTCTLDARSNLDGPCYRLQRRTQVSAMRVVS